MELGASLSTDGLGTAALQLDWLAINDDASGDPPVQTGTGSGSVGTGTVEPSGMNEPIGRITLTR